MITKVELLGFENSNSLTTKMHNRYYNNQLNHYPFFLLYNSSDSGIQRRHSLLHLPRHPTHALRERGEGTLSWFNRYQTMSFLKGKYFFHDRTAYQLSSLCRFYTTIYVFTTTMLQSLFCRFSPIMLSLLPSYLLFAFYSACRCSSNSSFHNSIACGIKEIP